MPNRQEIIEQATTQARARLEVGARAKAHRDGDLNVEVDLEHASSKLDEDSKLATEINAAIPDLRDEAGEPIPISPERLRIYADRAATLAVGTRMREGVAEARALRAEVAERARAAEAARVEAAERAAKEAERATAETERLAEEDAVERAAEEALIERDVEAAEEDAIERATEEAAIERHVEREEEAAIERATEPEVLEPDEP